MLATKRGCYFPWSLHSNNSSCSLISPSCIELHTTHKSRIVHNSETSMVGVKQLVHCNIMSVIEHGQSSGSPLQQILEDWESHVPLLKSVVKDALGATNVSTGDVVLHLLHQAGCSETIKRAHLMQREAEGLASLGVQHDTTQVFSTAGSLLPKGLFQLSSQDDGYQLLVRFVKKSAGKSYGFNGFSALSLGNLAAVNGSFFVVSVEQ